MLEWLKTVLGDAYTPEIDTAVSQEIGKGFVARTDFNTKTAKVTELETEVKQLREGIKTRDTQLSELKSPPVTMLNCKSRSTRSPSRTRTRKPPMIRSWPRSS